MVRELSQLLEAQIYRAQWRIVCYYTAVQLEMYFPAGARISPGCGLVDARRFFMVLHYRGARGGAGRLRQRGHSCAGS